jgi:hypothetical protein
MTTVVRLSERTDGHGLPWDLTDWVPVDELLQWIEHDVETLDWNSQAMVNVLRNNPAFRPKQWLRVMLFGYLTGIYSSEEIVSFCYEREPYKSICGDAPPRRFELVTFRRENRALLKIFLVQLLKRALKHKFGQTFLAPNVKQQLIEAAVLRLNLARDADRNNEV